MTKHNTLVKCLEKSRDRLYLKIDINPFIEDGQSQGFTVNMQGGSVADCINLKKCLDLSLSGRDKPCMLGLLNHNQMIGVPKVSHTITDDSAAILNSGFHKIYHRLVGTKND